MNRNKAIKMSEAIGTVIGTIIGYLIIAGLVISILAIIILPIGGAILIWRSVLG